MSQLGKSIEFDRNKNIFSYISNIAIERKKHIATSYNNIEETYEDLFTKVVNLAIKLTEKGLRKGDRVALYLDKSDNFVAVVLATLVLGVCYIPVDKSYPKKLSHHILKDSSPKLVITDCFLTGFNGTILSLSDLISKKSCDWYMYLKNKEQSVSGSDAAYIIYTSGSTGKPKGILVSHRSINNHMLWMRQQFSLKKEDAFLLRTPLTFDPSVWEMLLPFYIGSKLVISNTENLSDIEKIKTCIVKNKISVIQFTPVIFSMFLDFYDEIKMPSLRYFFVGGESLSYSIKKKYFDKQYTCKLINLYGPAEATIDTTYYEVINDPLLIKRDIIGRPISNVNIDVVDEFGNICGNEVIGEIVISGEGVSLGYLNNDEENENSFLNLKNSKYPPIYKTGDLARKIKNVGLEFIGRKDCQIKINGVRIELQGMKDFFLKKKGVKDCFFEKKSNKGSNSYSLICYILPENEMIISSSCLKKEMKRFFPEYILPDTIHIIKGVELTKNGKLNLVHPKSIPLIDRSTLTDIEKKLLAIWDMFLPFPTPSLSCDFFECGGTSITAYMVGNTISNELRTEFNFSDIVTINTIEKQYKYLKNIKIKKKYLNISSLNEDNKEKLFLIHPIGGTIFWYLKLAKYVSGSIQVYGISDPEIHLGGVDLDSIYDIAEYYSEIILSSQPSGPFKVGGASFGATIAVEVARILIKKGHKVEKVISLDGWGFYPNELKDENYFLRSMENQQKKWSDELNGNDFEHLFLIQKKRLKSLFKYKARPLKVPMILFKAHEIMPVFKSIDNDNNCWNELFSNLITVVVPGNHETMFEVPNVKYLSAEILKYNYLDVFTN